MSDILYDYEYNEKRRLAEKTTCYAKQTSVGKDKYLVWIDTKKPWS